MKGRKRIPTPILRMRGSWVAQTRDDEPQVPVGVADPRGLLDDESQKEFEHIKARLEGMRVWTVADDIMVARYAAIFVQYRRVMKVLQAGKVMTGKYNAAMNHVIKLAATLGRLEAEMGFTPASRSRLHVEKGTNDKTGKERFFA